MKQIYMLAIFGLFNKKNLVIIPLTKRLKLGQSCESHTKELSFYEFFDGLIPQSGRRLLVAYRGYFDESGTHANSRVLSFAGYLTSLEYWDKFDKSWRKFLANDIGVEYFHMTDFESCHAPQFKHIKLEDKPHLFKKAKSIIREHVLKGFSYSVNLYDYEEVITGAIRGQVGNPYTFCIAGCFREIEYWSQSIGNHEPISYVFEVGANCRGDIDHFMNDARQSNHAPHFQGSWTFGDKKQFTPLQAADILAYETWKYWSGTASSTKRPPRKSFRSLMGINTRGLYVSHQGLTEFKQMWIKGTS